MTKTSTKTEAKEKEEKLKKTDASSTEKESPKEKALEKKQSIQESTKLEAKDRASASTGTTTSPNRLGVVGAVVAVVVIALLAGLGTAVLAAQQLGSNTVFSQFANTVPVERLPVVKNFAKSPLQLLSRSIEVESDIEFQKSLNGREMHTGAKIDFTGMSENLEFTATGNFKNAVSFNGGLDQFKYIMSMGGQFEAGAVGINPGEEAVKIEMLQPNFNEVYFKLNLSSPMLKTIKSASNPRPQYPSSVESNEFKVEDYLDKYMRVDLKEYFGMLREQLPEGSDVEIKEVDTEKLYNEYYALYGKLNPDMKALYQKTLGQWDRYATAQFSGREKVGTYNAIWIDAQVDPEKFADVGWEYVSGIPQILKDHREDLLKYCQETSMIQDGNRGCEDVFGPEAFEKIEKEFNNNPDAKKRVEEGFKNFFKNVKFQKVRFAINPVDNSILKMNVELAMDKEAFQNMLRAMEVRERQIETFPLHTLTLTITANEVQRGHNFAVEVPAESINFVEKMREYIEEQKRQARQRQEEYMRQQQLYRNAPTRYPSRPPSTIN